MWLNFAQTIGIGSLSKETTLTQKLIAESAGTFGLVFTGTGAIVLNDVYDGSLGQIGIALAFGLAVTTMIIAVGKISGAHINPAVTLGFAAAGRMPLSHVAPFIASQIVGGILASVLVVALCPAHETLGASIPAGSVLQSFVWEMVMTLLLMWVILMITAGPKTNLILIGLAVGAVVGLEAFFGGPISGASMNPARSIGPAIVSMNLSILWLYIAAPVFGAIAAVPFCRCTRNSDCCSLPSFSSNASSPDMQ